MDFLRELNIGINFVEITIGFFILLYFIRSYRKDRLKATGYAILGFSLTACARIFYIIFDYYIPEALYHYSAWVFLYLGILFLMTSLFKGVSRSIFRDFHEKNQYFIIFGVYLVLIWIIREFSSIAFYIGSVGLGVLLLIPLALQLNKLIHKSGGIIKRYFSLAILGLPLAFLGIGIGSIWDDLPEIDGWLVKICSHSIFLISLILLALALWALPGLNEFEWEKSLSQLHIMKPGGVCLYSFNFKEIKSIDSQLLGSGLAGVVAIVQEMTKSKKQLNFIKQEQKNIYLQQGKSVTVVIIGDEELRIIYDKLRLFVQDFERLFPDISIWSFCTEEFKIANMLVRSIFSL